MVQYIVHAIIEVKDNAVISRGLSTLNIRTTLLMEKRQKLAMLYTLYIESMSCPVLDFNDRTQW